jgi:hypothetical protein
MTGPAQAVEQTHPRAIVIPERAGCGREPGCNEQGEGCGGSGQDGAQLPPAPLSGKVHDVLRNHIDQARGGFAPAPGGR